MQFHASLARFRTQLQADGRSPHTLAQYARHVRRFGAWLEAVGVPDDVTALEPEYVAAFVASAEAQRRRDGGTRRAGSLNALRSSLRGFFGYLEPVGLIERSPARVLRMVGSPRHCRGGCVRSCTSRWTPTTERRASCEAPRRSCSAIVTRSPRPRSTRNSER